MLARMIPSYVLAAAMSRVRNNMMLTVLDWTLFFGHVCLIIFNMTGWIWKKTRLWHLVTMSLTAFSWFGLGAIYGWGYCFCTDYHAEILRELGNPDADLSFIQLLFKRLFHISLSQSFADNLAIVVFALIVVATTYVWVRQWYRRKCSET